MSAPQPRQSPHRGSPSEDQKPTHQAAALEVDLGRRLPGVLHGLANRLVDLVGIEGTVELAAQPRPNPAAVVGKQTMEALDLPSTQQLDGFAIPRYLRTGITMLDGAVAHAIEQDPTSGGRGCQPGTWRPRRRAATGSVRPASTAANGPLTTRLFAVDDPGHSMRVTAAASFPLFLAAAGAQMPPRVDLQEVPFPMVRVQDPFFAPRRAVNLRVTLEHSLRQLEETGTLGNFDLAAAGKHDGFKGYVFQDSDAFKALEAIAFALATDHDPALAARFDAIVDRIGKAQQPDGYLNSAYTV